MTNRCRDTLGEGGRSFRTGRTLPWPAPRRVCSTAQAPGASLRRERRQHNHVAEELIAKADWDVKALQNAAKVVEFENTVNLGKGKKYVRMNSKPSLSVSLKSY